MKRETTQFPLPDSSEDKLETVLVNATHEQLCTVIREKA